MEITNIDIYMSMITNIEERIAEEVRKYLHLYNTSLKDYKDARMTANSAAVELDTKTCDCLLFHSLYITIPPGRSRQQLKYFVQTTFGHIHSYHIMRHIQQPH